jgi:hypothetical protein
VSEHRKEKKIIIFVCLNLFALFASVYLLSGSGPNFYNTDASELRIQVAKSIIENANLSVPKGMGVQGADGRDYSWLGIGSVLIAVPFYIAVKLTGVQPEFAVSIINQLFSAGTVVLIFLFAIALGYSRRASLLISIFYGLGTFAWPLAKQPFDHPIETFFILLSVYSLYLYVTNRKILNLLFSAFSLGFAFITRPTSLLVVPPLFIMLVLYSVKRFDRRTVIKMILRDSVMFSLVFLPFLGLNLWYNYYRFGSIFETGYQLRAARAGTDLFTNTSLLRGLSGFLISPGKCFFYYSPIAILFFFSIKSFLKRHRGTGISFIFIMVSYLLFLSKYVYWHGNWAWGPRFILVLAPFFILPIAELIDSPLWVKKPFLKSIVYSIFVVSIVIQLAAVSVDFQKYFFNLRVEEGVKFKRGHAGKVQRIVYDPYFDWHKSPILAQFKFVYQIASDLKDYRYSPLPENATLIEKIKVYPYMNIFDFWWAYKYFLDGSYSGFIVALLLLLISIYSASRLWKTIKSEPRKRLFTPNN